MSRISDEQLKIVLPDQAEAQSTMKQLDLKRAEAASRMMRQYVSDSTEENTFFKDRKEATYLQNQVTGLKKFLEGLHEEDPERDDYSHELYTKNRALTKLQKKLNDTSAFDFLQDLTKFAYHEELVELYDAIADRIGKWFEAGNAGPGTITYNGKTYTSSAS